MLAKAKELTEDAKIDALITFAQSCGIIISEVNLLGNDPFCKVTVNGIGLAKKFMRLQERIEALEEI